MAYSKVQDYCKTLSPKKEKDMGRPILDVSVTTLKRKEIILIEGVYRVGETFKP